MKIIWLGIFVSLFVNLGMVAVASAQSGSTDSSLGNDEKALSGTRQPSPPAGPDQDRDTCVIADPTGTPLNIRTSPNGKIVGKIANGERVRNLRPDHRRRQAMGLYFKCRRAPDGLGVPEIPELQMSRLSGRPLHILP